MRGKSMGGDESKKMIKEKPIQNTEKKRNQYIAPDNMEAWQRKKKKEKEREKGKTASVCSDPLGRERAGPIRSALAIWDKPLH